MRAAVLGAVLLLAGAAQAFASTVTQTAEINHWTTDWTPFAQLAAEDAQTLEVYGSEIFEDYHNAVPLPVFAAPALPDWVRISYDLTMTATTGAAGGAAGSFAVHLPGTGTLIAHGSFDYGLQQVARRGSMMLGAADIGAFMQDPRSRRALGVFEITGGAAARARLHVPQGNPFDHERTLWGATQLEASLQGAITVTAGWGSPANATSPAPVPLPGAGLLLGAALMGGLALRRRV